LLLGQHFRLERLQARSQRRPTLPNLVGTDQPEGRVSGEALGVVYILIPGQPAVDRLPQQVGQRQLDILAPPGIAQVAVYEFAQAETFVQLAHQNQATVGGHSRALKLDPQSGVERELKGPLLRLTHRLATSAPPDPIQTHVPQRVCPILPN
jgi:hypothetical protein